MTQDAAAMRQVRELERLIESRLEEARHSHAQVDAATRQAELLVAEAAAEAAAEADGLTARILDEARAWVLADEAAQRRIAAAAAERAVRMRDDLVATTVSAVLTVADTAVQPTGRTPGASR